MCTHTKKNEVALIPIWSDFQESARIGKQLEVICFRPESAAGYQFQ